MDDSERILEQTVFPANAAPSRRRINAAAPMVRRTRADAGPFVHPSSLRAITRSRRSYPPRASTSVNSFEAAQPDRRAKKTAIAKALKFSVYLVGAFHVKPE